MHVALSVFCTTDKHLTFSTLFFFLTRKLSVASRKNGWDISCSAFQFVINCDIVPVAREGTKMLNMFDMWNTVSSKLDAQTNVHQSQQPHTSGGSIKGNSFVLADCTPHCTGISSWTVATFVIFFPRFLSPAWCRGGGHFLNFFPYCISFCTLQYWHSYVNKSNLLNYKYIYYFRILFCVL